MSDQLPAGYIFKELSSADFDKYWTEWGKRIFSDNDTSMDMQRVLSEHERAKVRELGQNLKPVGFNLCVFKGDEFCGWFTGGQYTHETFYMRNSAILPEHRRKGLYTALMNAVLARVKEMGFQIVLSRHTNTNNAIIIPKLKAGFVVTAMELSDRFGTLLHLSYFFNETRKKVLEFRSGESKPDKQVKDLLGID